MLASLIKLDVPLRGYVNTRNPTMKDVFGRLSEDLRPLLSVTGSSPPPSETRINGVDQSSNSNSNSIENSMEVDDGDASEALEECDGVEPEDSLEVDVGEAGDAMNVSVGSSDFEVAKRMMDCVTRIILLSVTNSVFSFNSELHELLPLVSSKNWVFFLLRLEV